jgi:RNA polymerase sigma-70 factor, ECF subfamily
MSTATMIEQARKSELTDEQVVKRVLEGETALFEIIMRRYNQRLYRVARIILRDDGEAEDVMQDTYVRAYQHLNQFAGKAKFSTWLTRIAVHEALARMQKRKRLTAIEDVTQSAGESMTFASSEASPEQQATTAEVKVLLESAILALPEGYRSVLMMRDIEELSTAETAESLDLTEENVKVRLHRARALLRKELYARAGESRSTVFPFMGERCDRVVKVVLLRIAHSGALV